MWLAAIAALLKKQYPPYRPVAAWCPGGRHRPYAARSPASTVVAADSATSTAERAAAYVPSVIGVVVSKHHQPSCADTPRRLGTVAHSLAQARHREHVGYDVVGRALLALVLRPRGREEPHQTGIVHRLDRRDPPLGGLVDREAAVGLQRRPDHLGPARLLERRLEPRRLDLPLWVVQAVPLRCERAHHARASVSSRYCSRHFARCSLPDDVFGSVPGWTRTTSRGGMPQTSRVR